MKIKHFLVFFIFLNIFNKSYTQCKVDSILFYGSNDSLKKPLEKVIYTYNNKQLQETEKSFYYSEPENTWIISLFMIYNYNNENKLKSIIDIAENNDVFDTSSKLVYFYNNKGLDSLRILYFLNNSTSKLEIFSRNLNYFNNENNLIEQISQSYNKSNQTWTNYLKINLFYKNNKLISTINNKWDEQTNTWINENKSSSFYGNNIQIDSSFKWSLIENKWIFEQEVYTYFNSKMKDTLIESYYSNGVYLNGFKKVYDENDCLKRDSIFNFNKVYNGYRDYFYQKNTSINTYNISIKKDIYPNPSTSEIHVLNSIGEFRIIDFQSGKEIKKGVIQSNSEIIDISNLRAGVYIFKNKNNIQKIIKL